MDAVEQVPGFTSLERVGQGGFSVVYRAFQEHLQRTVALKVLNLAVADDRELRRFQRECQLTGRLTGHPHIVTVLDTGATASGRPYVVMEYFEGGSLHDRLAGRGPLPVDEVLRTGVKIAGALAAAHEAGILHRDVKPQNILVSRYGEPALADFGIATLMGSVDVTVRSHALTPYHAAPEILEGRAPSVASDVYALSSTLYQLLAGRPAYQRGEETTGSLAPVLLRILHEEPPDIVRPDVPRELVSAVRQGMARNPEERFPGASALAERLRALQSALGLPVTELVPTGGAPTPTRSPQVERDLTVRVGRLDSTVAMPGLVIERPGAPAPPRPSRRRLYVIGLGAVLGCALAASVLIGARLLPHSPSSRTAATPAASPTSAGAVAPPAVMDAARPRSLAAVDRGASVSLRWQLGTGDQYPLFVQQTAAGHPPAPLSPLPAGSTSTVVGNLDPHAGYCFQVGALVALGQPSAVAWSQPVCIRGAVAQPPSPSP